MDWLLNYLPQVLMTIGILALILEVVILGFATFIFFFVGLSFVISGFCMYMEWLPNTLSVAVWANIILTLVLALVLWRPFKSLQNKPVLQKTSSDFAQITFLLEKDINAHQSDVFYAYSGINWQVKSEQPLCAGQQVKVIKMEVGTMWVEAINS